MTIQYVCKVNKVKHPVLCVPDCEAALLSLRHHLDENPCLILLDIQCSELGIDYFLEHLQSDSELAQIPVIALGGEPDEQLESYLNRPEIADVVSKATDYAELADQMGRLLKYWTELRLAAAAA